MKVWYALADEELDRFYIFREMESRLRADLPVKSIEEIKAAVYEAQEAEGGQLLYETRDGAAVIAVSGTLTAKRHISDDLYGDATSYADIERAVLAAEADPLVREIHYHINSPGGYWDGLDCCAEAVKTARKPSTAFVYTSALSGGYYLASQADRILAVTKGSSVGSIGVAAEVFDRTGADGQKGITRHVLTNRASGDKRPKPEEEAGRELIVDRLDQLYGIFENRVLDGRRHVKGFNAETIRSLAGRTVTAEQALELGLIDGIRSEESEEDATGMEEGMKLADYLAANPGGKEELALYAAEALGMIDKAAVETQVNKGIEAALAADRARIEELLALSGAPVSGPLKAAVAGGVDAGEFAKARVKELSAALSASNAGALGKPGVEQHLGGQTAPKDGGAAAGAVVDEQAIRDMARKGGF